MIKHPSRKPKRNSLSARDDSFIFNTRQDVDQACEVIFLGPDFQKGEAAFL
jgi:hypothetical protein